MYCVLLQVFFLSFFLVYLKELGEERGKSLICWFTSQMVVVLKPGALQGLGPPMWMQGPTCHFPLLPQVHYQDAGLEVEQLGLQLCPYGMPMLQVEEGNPAQRWPRII